MEESPSGSAIWVLSTQDKSSNLLSSSRASEGAPSYSPDGRWLAYVSNETGQTEVYVRPASGGAGKWRVSTGGGTFPLWAGNGRELFFRSDEKVLAVDVAPEPVFAAGKPRLIFERPYVSEGGSPNYDVARDGQRLLMVKPDPQVSRVTEVNVVQNWLEELKRLVPTK
jgi:serine/threonine-protein kinase